MGRFGMVYVCVTRIGTAISILIISIHILQVMELRRIPSRLLKLFILNFLIIANMSSPTVSLTKEYPVPTAPIIKKKPPKKKRKKKRERDIEEEKHVVSGKISLTSSSVKPPFLSSSSNSRPPSITASNTTLCLRALPFYHCRAA